MRRLPALAAACLLLGLTLGTGANAQSRGELLYATHCRGCHDSQMHWRDKRAVTDWSSLKQQVSRWQAVGALGWGEDDVRAVARYLNTRFYRFERVDDPVSATLRDQVPQ